MKRSGILLGLCLTFSLWAQSAVLADSRIRTMAYTEDRVVDLLGVYGFQVSIEFPDDERIENVAIGDSVAWQVTPNKSGTTLFVKPVEEGEPTNMTVVTTARRYSFALTALRQSDVDPSEVLFVLRFEPAPRPEPEPALGAREGPAVPQENDAPTPPRNKSYTYSGSATLIPSEIFDDGRVTYFRWADGVEVPAIFLIGSDGKESIVNYAFAGEYIIVDRVAREFSLRLGSDVTRLHNEGFTPIDPGPDAPAPRTQETKKSVFSAFRRRK